MNAKEIWEKLSRIDVSDHVEKKGGLSYLSWSWAWSTLMDHYPGAYYDFRDWDGNPAFVGEDGTASVECTLTVGEVSRTMWLPVMDHRNRAVQNPDSRAISDCRMRCLTKCIALFGLGMYLYAGEDLPRQDSPTSNRENGKAPSEKKVEAKEESTPIEGVVTTYEVFSESATTQEELVEWWQSNFQELKKLEENQPETYKAVLGVFSERKAQIKTQEKSNGK